MSQVAEVNGLKLVYEDGGQGTAIVTLHGGPGMGSRAGDWAAFQPLTDNYRLISYDQRGNGESEGAEPYSHAQFVADLEALRQQLGLGKIVVLGGSYGGFLALEYALAHPENLHAVILRDTAASNRFQGTSKERALSSGFPMDEETLDRLFSGQVRDNDDFRTSYAMIQPLYTVERDPAAEAERLARIPFRYETHNWAFSRNQPGYDLTGRLGEITVPVLVTVGRHDWITPLEASEELAAALPQSELVVFEHSGHSPQLEERERYLTVVRDFLARHVPATA
ncbi:alpha/beta fold hydrolase (plasmid) [Deinococcus metallilatus]|uniref:Alpha/beta fold hydrolase n=1 Tax=Deinococcus metallilatus TaxID=1211322 RepID=A0AAJ5FAL9_9DEIO|nr:alpha/beta fold hydrolase [Deinococcus metallilatus]QBY07074.1 alpha/beta fold hydrolase [Deinococcus metallilatus]RXJ18156.1 alpha/beta fold hydrolase [Deinococcus metallilatus]TLK32362.1 alpha/beta fold hydrolase [Deinococcus metallilatus]GMA15307.1 hydrolase [Deinococcus metallilatus]